MGKTYSEKLLDPRWQRRRLEILNRHDFHCESCGDGENTIHVHHKHYAKGREPWEYEDYELVALCKDCHETEHDYKHMLNEVLASIPLGCIDMVEVISLVAGYLYSQGPYSDDHPDAVRLRAVGESWGYGAAFEIGIDANQKVREWFRELHRKSVGER